MKKNRIGCSGFVYPEWKGKFYPADLPRSKWLEYYSRHFNTVELNGTFYRFPAVKNLKAFSDSTPPDFQFSIKANRVITHTLKMRNAVEKTEEFVRIAKEGLGSKLGCILFQLPPSFMYSEENLGNVLECVPHHPDSVVEFRDGSWWNERVYKAFEKNKITFCNNDYPGMPETIIGTKKFFYMRFHGKPVLYKSEYSPEQLKHLALQIPEACDQRYVYFNNTWFLAAIKNAGSMKEVLESI